MCHIFNVRGFELTPRQLERTRSAYVQDIRDMAVYYVANVETLSDAVHAWMRANYSCDYDVTQIIDPEMSHGGCVSCQRRSAMFQVYLNTGDE
jgi:hypothetical protein